MSSRFDNGFENNSARKRWQPVPPVSIRAPAMSWRAAAVMVLDAAEQAAVAKLVVGAGRHVSPPRCWPCCWCSLICAIRCRIQHWPTETISIWKSCWPRKSLELYEDLEFYEWLDVVGDAG